MIGRVLLKSRIWGKPHVWFCEWAHSNPKAKNTAWGAAIGLYSTLHESGCHKVRVFSLKAFMTPAGRPMSMKISNTIFAAKFDCISCP
ncbi:hypothetical protein CW696_04010 [ANME-2 cluster archaeon]|nr:MAG: hypothetical protein CW696_04010 [ANME-2 cluster archaeon]